MAKSNFLCGSCRSVLCEDCLSIADEYATLLQNASQSAYFGTQDIEYLKRKLATAERQAKMWEEISKIGLPQLMREWLDERVAKMIKVDERLAANDAIIKGLKRKGT